MFSCIIIITYRVTIAVVDLLFYRSLKMELPCKEEFSDGIKIFLYEMIVDLSAEVEFAIENVNKIMDIVEDYAKSNSRFSATVTFTKPWLEWTCKASEQVSSEQVSIIAGSFPSPNRWNQLMNYVKNMVTVAEQVTKAMRWKKIPEMDDVVTKAYISSFKILDIVLKVDGVLN
jgi:hypothetical protein